MLSNRGESRTPESIEVTDPSAFERSSLGKQILFAVVRAGLSDIYWFYRTAGQIAEGTNADVDPLTTTLLLFVPFYGMWKVATVAEVVTDQAATLVFLLFLFTGFGGWYLVQSGINELAEN